MSSRILDAIGWETNFLFFLPFLLIFIWGEALKYKPLGGLALVPTGFVKEENIYNYMLRHKNGMNKG
jgi:hypothetical protein